jgi:hypothetical protein
MVRILDFDDSQSSANPPGAGTTGFFAEYGEFTFDAASGTSIDVTTLFSAKSPGGAESTEGVITSAPQNVVQIAEKTTGGEIEDGEGDKVFARITEAAGTWTLSFFTNEAGAETAHSLSSQDIKFLYREVFTLENKPTIGASVLTYDSQNALGDIPDAGAGQRGVVNTSAQTMDGVKEFSSRPTSGGVELGRKVEVEDEGGSVETDLKKINFIGAGVTAAQNGSGNVDVTIPGGGGGGSAVEVEDEGVSLTTDVTKINFVGAGVTATEPVADQITVTIPGGGGGSIVVEDEGTVVDAVTTTVDFVGAGVTATQESAGNVTVTIPGGGGAISDSFENENIRYSGFTSRNGSDYILLKTEEFNDSSGNMVSYSEPGGDHSRFTFDSPCLFSAQMACQGSLNPKELLWFNSADTLLMSSYDEIDSDRANAGLVGRASTGDYLVYRSSDNPTDDDQCNFAVIAMDVRKPGASKWESYSTTGFTSANGAGQILFKTVKEDSTGTISTVTTGDHTRFTFNEDTDFWASTSVRSSSGQGLVQIALFNSSNTQIITTVDVATTGEGGVACLAARASAGDYLIAAKQAAITASDSLDTNFNIMVADIDPVSGYESDAISRSGFTSKNGSGFVRLSTAHQDSGGPLVTFSEPGSDHTRYTFDKECSFTANFGVSAASSGVVEVRQYNSSDVLIQRGTDRAHSSTSGSACLVSKASVGDYIVAYMDSATSDNNSNTSFSVVATEVTPAIVGGGTNVEIENEGTSLTTAVTKINFKGTDITVSEPVADEIDVQVGDAFAGNPEDFNMYSAVVTNSGAAAVFSQSQAFIQSVSRTALGVVDVVFTPGFFSAIPSVHATISEQDSNGDEGCFISAISTSGFTLNTTADSAAFDQDFNVECIRQGADYDDKGPDDNFYGAIIANNGTASVTSESKTFIQSVNRTATGTVDVVFTPGFFTIEPMVHGSINNLALQGDEGVFIQSLTTSGFTFRTTADSIAHDVPVTIHAVRQAGDYAGTPSGSENFFGAKIQNNGTSSITSESQTFIQSVNRTGTGITDIVFTPGLFTTPPALTGGIEETAANGDEGVFIYNITSSGCTLETTADSSAFDQNFTLLASRQGGDYNSPGLPRKGFLGVLTSDPVSPSNGESWINSTDKKHKFRTGGVTYSSAAYT